MARLTFLFVFEQCLLWTKDKITTEVTVPPTQDNNSLLWFPLLYYSHHAPPSSPSQYPHLSFACPRCLVCSAQHAFIPQPHSLCVELTHLPAKRLASGNSQYVHASLCQHAASSALCTACGWEIGVGIDIDSFKYVSTSMPLGATALCLVSMNLHQPGQSMVGSSGPL